MQFRYDINAIRAVAVLLVVLFHFGISFFSAGFIGVDVFFVISGYLMTSIIVNKLNDNNFSILNFYLARAKRIIPALAVLCLVLLILGYFFLIPKDYEQLGKHVAASIGFISNNTYLNESGYFNAESHEKLLLHTWSLSVEWQFYLLFPLIVAALYRFMGNKVSYGIVALFFASLGLSIVITAQSPEQAYFSFYTRTWEMLAGGLVAIFPHWFTSERSKNIAFYSGLVLLCTSLFLIDEKTLWPGYMAVLPILATVLILFGNNQTNKILNSSIVQWIGSRSYSIYLWHWPIAALMVLLGLIYDPVFIVLGILASFVLGHFSYQWVELKVNKQAWLTWKSYKGAGVYFGIVSLVWILGRGVFVLDGVPERAESYVLPHAEQLVMPTRKNGWCFNDYDKKNKNVPSIDLAICRLGEEKAEVKGLLFGDSFAAHYEPFWGQLALDRKFALDVMTTNWCFPSFSDEFTGKKQHKSYQQCLINRKLLREAVSNYDFIVFAGHWHQIEQRGLIDEIYPFVDEVAKSGKRIILMPSPTIFDVNVLKRYKLAEFNNIEFNINTVSKRKDVLANKLNQKLEEYIQQYDNISMLDRASLFSSDVSKENIPLSLDGRHLTIYGALQSYQEFKNSDQYKQLVEKGIL